MAVAALFVLGIPLILIALLATAFFVAAIANMGWAMGWTMVLFMPLVVLGGAALLLCCVDFLKRRVLADHPQQCWAPSLEDASADESMAI
jgi:hypothetical protein